MTALKVGFVTKAERDRILALEALGADSLWVGGHIAGRNPGPDAVGGLMRLALLSERSTVGTAVLLMPLYPPALVAKQFADLDVATSGRVVLGIGVGGEYPAEFSACQIPLGERGARTDEAILVVRALWSGEEVTRSGRFFPMEGVRVQPAPSRPGGPPIVVAGRRPPAMRRAALLGDGWMPYLYSARRYAESRERISEIAGAAGRDLSTFEWYAYVFVAVDGDARRARAVACDRLQHSYGQDFTSMIDRVAVAGTPEIVAERLADMVDAGARHLLFNICNADWAPVAALLMDEIVPSLRDKVRLHDVGAGHA